MNKGQPSIRLKWRTRALLGLLLLACSLLFWRWLSHTVDSTPAPVVAVPLTEQLWLTPTVEGDILQRVAQRQSEGVSLFPNAASILQAREEPSLFEPTKRDAASLSRSPLATSERLQPGHLWIDYSLQVLAARVEGDKFEVHLPGLSNVMAEIDRVELVQGRHRWLGRLTGLPDVGHFSITQSVQSQYAVGAFTTAYGEFLLEAKDGLGWVAESSLEFRLPPDGKDYIHAEDAH